MKKLLLIGLMASAANAVECRTDVECAREGLRLAKQANKLNACQEPRDAVLLAIEWQSFATLPSDNDALDACIREAKARAKALKATAKMIEQAKGLRK